MGELTECNRCTLNWIKADAKSKRQEIKVRWDAKIGMWEVTRDGAFSAYLLKLTKKCAC